MDYIHNGPRMVVVYTVALPWLEMDCHHPEDRPPRQPMNQLIQLADSALELQKTDRLAVQAQAHHSEICFHKRSNKYKTKLGRKKDATVSTLCIVFTLIVFVCQ